MQAGAARSVFYVSDGSGGTAEALGHGLLAQFDGRPLREVKIGEVDSFARLYAVVDQLRAAREADGAAPIVFATLVNVEHVQALKALDCVCFDLFEMFCERIATALQAPPTRRMRESRDTRRAGERQARMAAIDFALAHDDGASAARLAEADVVLVGVSRSGKTPTCLYLAMQHGVKAANCPLTPDDFERGRLPQSLEAVRDKLIGLTVTPQRLADARSRRLPDSRYASPDNCRDELDAALRLMRREGIYCFDATTPSIEELAGAIRAADGLDRCRRTGSVVV
jgi:regulator of PEP synthase PpsR (kinase-PPPase family)